MKKVLVLLLAAALLLTVGCAGTGEATGSGVPLTETGSPVAEDSTAGKTEPVQTTAAPVTELPVSTEPLTTEAPVTEPATEASVPTTAVPEPVDPWTLLGVASFDQGTCPDGSGDTFSYSYEIPCVQADTEGARAVNAAIDARFGAVVRDAKEAIADGVSPGVVSIGFRGAVWEDVLTVIVIEYFDFDWSDYGVYCYEVTTGRQLTTPMVLARMGVSEADFLETCRTRFREAFEDRFSGVPEEYREEADYDRQLEWQTSDEYVNLNLMAYPSADGIVVVAPIMSLAGPAFFYEEMPLGIGSVG